MNVIPDESGSFYVFDHAYNAYHRLYKIHMMDSVFVVRAKINIKLTFAQEYIVRV
ncbi:MAG: hypothetical protein SOR57_10615 [Parabacteroides sp.]|nr:hypothetical protein [Parabacteroides sp.]